jgi:hypothetical protein
MSDRWSERGSRAYRKSTWHKSRYITDSGRILHSAGLGRGAGGAYGMNRLATLQSPSTPRAQTTYSSGQAGVPPRLRSFTRRCESILAIPGSSLTLSTPEHPQLSFSHSAVRPRRKFPADEFADPGENGRFQIEGNDDQQQVPRKSTLQSTLCVCMITEAPSKSCRYSTRRV